MGDYVDACSRDAVRQLADFKAAPERDANSLFIDQERCTGLRGRFSRAPHVPGVRLIEAHAHINVWLATHKSQ